MSLRTIACLAGAVAALAVMDVRAEASAAVPASLASRALTRLDTTMNGEFRGQRLEDCLSYIAELTGASFEPLWTDQDHPSGLDRESSVSLKFDGLTARTILERVLVKVSTDDDACTWQLTEGGAVQVGPRSRLNTYKSVRLYDIRDLLAETPNFSQGPRLDLQSALQGASSGGSSIFRESGSNTESGVGAKSLEQRAEEIKDLIQTFVETDQWQEHGGSGGVIRVLQGSLIVNAPDYVHRQIDGYRGR